MADWLSKHNHNEGKDEEITGLNLPIYVIKMWTAMPECMMPEVIRHTTQADDHLNALTMYVINGWPPIRTDIKE